MIRNGSLDDRTRSFGIWDRSSGPNIEQHERFSIVSFFSWTEIKLINWRYGKSIDRNDLTVTFVLYIVAR